MLYRFKKSGFFMGKYYAEGAEKDLTPKQAKYAELSGQIVAVKPVSQAFAAAKKTVKKTVKSESERVTPTSVGATVGGSVSKDWPRN